MSKLKLTLLFVLGFGGAAAGTFALTSGTQKPTVDYVWGKANIPISIRIVEKSVSPGDITLQVQIKSSRPQLELEWEVPKGVIITEGLQKETIEITNPEDITTREIRLTLESYIGAEHIFVRAYEKRNGKRGMANSYAYKLTETPKEELEKIKRIREHMKARNNQMQR